MSTRLNKPKKHSFFMNLALNQANKNLGNTKENPSVGCVIVKNNDLISVGCTSLNGRPHAEANAIKSSKHNVKNSDLYVTLEPCSHYGKTPPCVGKIVSKKINRVFFSINDPDVRSFNKSTKILRSKGVSVNTGLLKDKIKTFYRSYEKYKKSTLPFVTYKLAVSRDLYSISTKRKKYITNQFSRGRVHIMRSNHDCIITSSKTIAKDNSLLTCRINGLKHKSPSRIILDSKLIIPVNSQIITQSKNFKTIIFYNKFNRQKIELLNKLKVRTYKIPLDKNKNLDLRISLKKAKQLGFSRIFVESGIKLAISFLNNNLIDDFKLFVSRQKLGKYGKGKINNNVIHFLKEKKSNIEKVNLLGDKLISYKLK